MEDTRFLDLKVKVGFPYLYCHQGDCEHLVIITDIRSKQVLLQQSVSAPTLEHVFASLRAEILDLPDYLRICYKSMTSSTSILPGRSIWWFCHETWILKDTVLVTRSGIKPSLVSWNCASQDRAANLVPRMGGKGQWQRNLCVPRKRWQKLLFMSRTSHFFFYRLAHRSDCLDKTLYPLLTHKHRFTTQKCSVCHVFIGRCLFVSPSRSAWTNEDFESSFLPRWFTTGDRSAPSDPCLFCDKCFRMLHYDEHGNKLGEFQAFPFVDRGAFN